MNETPKTDMDFTLSMPGKGRGREKLLFSLGFFIKISLDFVLFKERLQLFAQNSMLSSSSGIEELLDAGTIR